MLHVFIINQTAGRTDMTEEIRGYLSHKAKFEYLVFNTDDEGSEYKLVKQIIDLFDGEQIRFYICGGTGSFVHAINAIDEKDIANVEIAHYPCGITNDYIKNFGNHSELFKNIENLINGETIRIDYVKCITDVVKSDDLEERRICMDKYIVSSGLGLFERFTKTCDKLRYILRFNIPISYNIAGVMAAFSKNYVYYNIYIDGENFSGKYCGVYLGNSVCTHGYFYPVFNANANDGYQDLILIKPVSLSERIRYLIAFKYGNIDSVAKGNVVVKRGKNITIERPDNKDMELCYDGECISVRKLNLKVIQNGLRYVVPSGVRIKSLSEIKRNIGK